MGCIQTGGSHSPPAHPVTAWSLGNPGEQRMVVSLRCLPCPASSGLPCPVYPGFMGFKHGDYRVRPDPSSGRRCPVVLVLASLSSMCHLGAWKDSMQFPHVYISLLSLAKVAMRLPGNAMMTLCLLDSADLCFFLSQKNIEKLTKIENSHRTDVPGLLQDVSNIRHDGYLYRSAVHSPGA